MLDMIEHFTPSWHRPGRKNDVVLESSSTADGTTAGPGQPLFWRRYPCLVCGKPPPPQDDNDDDANDDEPQNSDSSPPSSSNPKHKRCSRCHSTVYCSSECQKQDYIEGKHKPNCLALGKLWDEKSKLEGSLWKDVNANSTNPFDDEPVYDYPIVGKFWHDQPQSTLQKQTTKYCVVLLQLVQLLGRGESWRVSRIIQQQQQQQQQNRSSSVLSNDVSKRRGPGNPLSRELAIDLAYQVLNLDQTDMRVRLLLPSLLLEGGYYQEAYDYLKYWLQVDRSLMIMDLACMGGSEVVEDSGNEDGGTANKEICSQFPRGQDMFESPEVWMDSEMVYPSIGMVFELAFLKCHLLCSLKSRQFQAMDDCNNNNDDDASQIAFGTEEVLGNEPITIAKKSMAVGEHELERQVKLLLSVVHKWNSNLLPNLCEAYDIESGAASSSDSSSVPSSIAEEGVTVPATPPALSTLLQKHPPGFELQYKMGNPGGQSLDEAVSIWQRDMILWHVVDPRTMKFLSEFCSNLDDNLVDTSCLTGGGVAANNESSAGSSTTGTNTVEPQSIMANVTKRKEAEELVARLQRENPNRTMDEIMMHPEMAQLMIKHLHTE